MARRYVYYKKGNSTPRHILEHQVRPIRLEPLDQPAPAVTQYVQPTPILVNPVQQGQQPNHLPPVGNTKAEMMEMMMLQNAQMHQVIMNQMMMSNLPKNDSRSNSRAVDVDDLVRRRPPSVHHHHYEQPPPRQLPPLQVPHYGYPVYQSPRYYPAEMEPLQPPRVKKKSPRPQTPPKPPPPKKRIYGSLPFPGPWPLRRFRHAAYAVFFEKVLEKLLRNRRKRLFPDTALKALNPDFMFHIKLKEVVSALHQTYLNPANKIGNILRKYASDSSRDLVESFNSSKSSENKPAVEDLSYILENVVYEMTEIMPTTGVLGTHGKAALVDMCRPGKLYPKGYLWQIEKNRMDLDPSGRTRNLEDFQCFMLVAGIYLARGVVTTLLSKPLEYGLLKDEAGPKGQRNMKLIASTFIYLYRRILAPVKGEPADYPTEIARYLYPDDEMMPIYKKVTDSLNYADDLIRKWGEEYVSRIQNVLSEERSRRG